jgi:hypothetical protein
VCARVGNQQSRGVVIARVRTDVVRSLRHQRRDLHQSTYLVPLGRLGLILLSVIDLVRFEFESRIVLFSFSFIFVSFEELRLLVSWCVGGRCGMACSDEDRGRSRRPGVEDRGWSHR